MAIDSDNAYTGSWDGHFFTLNRKTGALRCAYNFGRPDSGAPVLYNGILFTVPYVEFLFALDASTGRPRWKRPVPEGRLANGTSSAHDGIIDTSDYVQQGRAPLGSRILALDVRDGKLVWEHPIGGGLTAPVIARDKVCFGSTEHVYFTCVDAKSNGDGTTRMLWRTRMGGPVDESCTAIHGTRAFVLAADRYLYAFE